MPQQYVALAGNPNCGKSTAFNYYTGARQSVGNYPGVTVEKKEGIAALGDYKIRLVDLPGTYSLTAYSLEEIIARRVLTEERPGAVINMVNAGVLERNLYLTVQLLELGLPVVIALNMMDEARAHGMEIDCARLAHLIDRPVVPTVARSGEGLDEALRAALDYCKSPNTLPDTSPSAPADAQTNSLSRPLIISYGPDIDAALMRMCPIIEDAHFLTALYPARWIALKYLEQDSEILAAGYAAQPDVDAQLKSVTAHTAQHIRSTLNTYPEALITDYRYGYIASLLRQGVLHQAPTAQRRVALSDAADRVLTHRYIGPAILIAILYAMYWLTFTLGEYPKNWLSNAIALLGEGVGAVLPDGLLKSLLVSGIIGGVGGVLSFVPLIAIMFVCISALEDSGYMARVAYMMDRIFRVFGLHGASVMPYIISGGIAGGCAIPGIMAARTLRSPNERLATILTVPFMACGAKLPVFLLFVGIFFERHQALLMFLLTLAGWITALVAARMLRSTIITGKSTPFVMELPPYRMPTLMGLGIHAFDRIWEYVKKAGTTILAIAILVWAAMTFPGLPAERADYFAAQRAHLIQAEASPHNTAALKALNAAEKRDALRASFAGRLGLAMEPVTQWAGFDWRTDIALLAGIAAKEVVVTTLGTVYALEVDSKEPSSLAAEIRLDAHWTIANALSLLLFTLLYSPCFPALAVIRHETGAWRWMAFSVVFNMIVAFSVATVVYQLTRWLLSG